jgi:3-methyladenine DNA glycosylase Tag
MSKANVTAGERPYHHGDLQRAIVTAALEVLSETQSTEFSMRELAARVLEVQEADGSLDAYLWGFVDGTPIVNRWGSLAEIPAETELSKSISKDLKRRGFRFVGPTVIYAFMQSVGMVDDHTADCFRRA